MRLVALILSALLAQAPVQGQGKLPWDSAAALPWKAGDCDAAAPAPVPSAKAEGGPIQVRLTPDGALRVSNDRGMLFLRTGLPGRPLRIWRDGGVPVADMAAPLFFPRESPISKGIGGIPVGSQDFRPALAGLLWILSDDEKILTVILPVTGRVAYLPMPGGQDFQLVFRPDSLEVREQHASVQTGEQCWSLPWLALLSQFIQLGQDNPANRPSGTALLPFPKS